MASSTRTRKTTPPPAPAAHPGDDQAPAFTSEMTAGAKDVGPLLFTVDGTEYRLPAQPARFGARMQFVRALRSQGLAFAQAQLIEHLVGPKGLAALERSVDLDEDRWEQVVNRASAYLLGDVDPEGN